MVCARFFRNLDGATTLWRSQNPLISTKTMTRLSACFFVLRINVHRNVELSAVRTTSVRNTELLFSVTSTARENLALGENIVYLHQKSKTAKAVLLFFDNRENFVKIAELSNDFIRFYNSFLFKNNLSKARYRLYNASAVGLSVFGSVMVFVSTSFFTAPSISSYKP